MTGDWMRLDPMVAFRAVLEDAGLRPKIVLADGGLHRCGTVGLEQGAGGSYYLHLDPPVSGWWKNYRTGKSNTWTGDKSEASGGEGFSRFLARLKADRDIRQEEDAKGHRTEDGACFEVHLEKARGIAGGVVEPFEAVTCPGLFGPSET